MSDAQTKPRTFFDLFSDGQATEDDADECVSAWHNSGDDERRPLTEFLGMTDNEYDLWTMDPRTLPALAAARRPGGPDIESIITDRVRRMRAANDPADRAALFSLTHWLRARGIEA